VTRPRAADDFAVIRARIVELRRERAQVSADRVRASIKGPRPYSVSSGRGPAGKSELPTAIRRALVKLTTLQ